MPTQSKSFKFRLYPTKVQADLMQRTFGCVRLVYNTVLARNLDGYKEHGKDWRNQFNPTYLKKQFDFLSEVSAATLQQSARNLQSAYEGWFKSLSGKRKGKKLSRPKFKSKHGSRKSFRLPNQKFSLGDQWIKLEKLGRVKAVIDRQVPSEAKLVSVTVSQDASGEYFASVCVEVEIDLYPPSRATVGIDLGLKDLLVLSNGARLSNPRWFRESQTELRKSQRHLSRKQRGSSRYTKQRIKVARVHRDTRNARSWLTHNISSALVKHFGVICVEDLNVSGMMKNHCLAKSIGDAAFGELVRQLEYKSAWRGRTLVKVDRFYPSSKTCSCCGHVNQELTLSDREWTCKSCSAIIDRDLNAAVNVHNRGLSDLSAESVDYRRGGFVSPTDPQGFAWQDSVKRLLNL